MVQNAGKKRVDLPEMENMPPNLYRTASGFLYRRTIPTDARDAIGKREIKKSLGRVYAIAKVELAKLEVQTNSLIAAARAQVKDVQTAQQSLEAYLNKPAKSRTKLITALTPELPGQISALWLAGLDLDLQNRRSGLLDDADFDELDANIHEMSPGINRALATGQVSKYYPAIHALMYGRGYELALDEASWQKLAHEVLQSYQHGYKVLKDRQSGTLTVPNTAALPAPLPAVWEIGTAPEVEEPALTWNKLFELWKSERPRPLKTVKMVQVILDGFVAFTKKNPAEIVKADVPAWLKHERTEHGNAAKNSSSSD